MVFCRGKSIIILRNTQIIIDFGLDRLLFELAKMWAYQDVVTSDHLSTRLSYS